MRILSAFSSIFIFAALSFSQTTSFTYQGRLTDSSIPANGTYDLVFRLYDAQLPGGNQIGPDMIRDDVEVDAGVFSVDLNFGEAAFSSGARFLHIFVRTGGSTAEYTPLNPRLHITSSPFAIKSLRANTAESATTALSATTAAVAGNVTGVVQVANGGTGSSTQNFVDLTNVQIIEGYKTFNNPLSVLNRVYIEDGGYSGLRVQTNSAGGTVASFGGNGSFDIDASGINGGRFKVQENGNVGIGTNAPFGKLQVTTANDTAPGTIAAWDPRHFVVGGPGSTGGVGFSYDQTNQVGYIGALSPNVMWRNLVLQSGGGNVGIGTATPNEKLDVNGNLNVSGAVALNGTRGQPGQVITSNGSGTPAQWKSSTNTLFQRTNMSVATAFVTPPTSPTLIPGMSQTINVSGNAKLVVQFTVYAQTGPCLSCGPVDFAVSIFLNGGEVAKWWQTVENNLRGATASGNYVFSVGPGSHTIEIRANNSSATPSSVSVGSLSTSISNLIVQTIPE